MFDLFDDFEIDCKVKKTLADRCKGCNSCEKVNAGEFSFLGCFHKPYHGKWIAEIISCPKEGEI